MVDQSDAEDLGIKILGQLGTGCFGVTMYWTSAVAGLITEFRSRMSSEQYSLALAVFQRWGIAIPFLLDDDAEPRIWLRGEAEKLKTYFSDTISVADRVELLCTRLERDKATAGRDALRILEARSYCQEVIQEIDHNASMGDITTEVKTFQNLAHCCKELFGVVLGPLLEDAFARRYNETMSVLHATVRLVDAPKV